MKDTPTTRAIEYIDRHLLLMRGVEDADWPTIERALWAASELLGLGGRRLSKPELERVKEQAIEVLMLYPEGLPEPTQGGE